MFFSVTTVTTVTTDHRPQWELIQQYHLCVRANETGFFCAGGGRPHTVHGLGGGETQGLAAAQRRGGQTAFPSSTAVVGDTECTALVVI